MRHSFVRHVAGLTATRLGAVVGAAFAGAAVLGAARPAAAQASSQCAAVAGNLVANCGFESGGFDGYTLAGNTANSGVDAFSAHSGGYGAYVGNRGAAQTITQTLATTAGGRYTFSFFLLSEEALGGTAFFRAFLGGQQVLDLESQAPLAYTRYSFTTTATGPATDLRFVVQNDLSFYDLDDLSVAPAATTTPEPAGVVLVGVGLLSLAAAARRRTSRA